MLESAKLKLDRANHHIRDLKSALDLFIQTYPDVVKIDHDADTGKVSVNIRLREEVPTPSTLSLIIGDAIHNLRTALDHAIWELIGLDGGTQDWTNLPARDTRQKYDDACLKVKTPRHDTKNFLINLAIYKDGTGKEVYGLHLLDNADKHAVLTPVVGVCSTSTVEFMNNGQSIGSMHNATSASFSVPPGTKLDPKSDFTVDIFFGDVAFVPKQPVIPTLVHLADVVADTLRQFEEFVRTRN